MPKSLPWPAVSLWLRLATKKTYQPQPTPLNRKEAFPALPVAG